MKVIGYARLSPRPEEKLGVEVQVKKMKAYAEAYDLELEIMIEPGLVSGKTLDRPVLQQALAMLKGGFAEGILVAKLDRLSRDLLDMSLLIKEYFKESYELFSVEESINTKNAAGRLLLNILMSVAQWEREAIGERTREALQHLIKQGVSVGRAPFGYEYTSEIDDSGRRVSREVPEEQDALGVMQFYRGRGHTLDDIAARLNAAEHKTKRGGEWHKGTVSKILRRAAPRKRSKKR